MWSQVPDSGNSAVGGEEEANGVVGVELPDVVRTNNLLEVNAQASDPDGDALETVCEWKRNGVVSAGEIGATLDQSRVGYGDKGNTISVVVLVGDGRGGPGMAPEVLVMVGHTLPRRVREH